MTLNETKEADDAWRQAYYSLIMAQKAGVISRLNFSGVGVGSSLTTTKAKKVPPFGSVGAKEVNKIKGHLIHTLNHRIMGTGVL